MRRRHCASACAYVDPVVTGQSYVINICLLLMPLVLRRKVLRLTQNVTLTRNVITFDSKGFRAKNSPWLCNVYIFFLYQLTDLFYKGRF